MRTIWLLCALAWQLCSTFLFAQCLEKSHEVAYPSTVQWVYFSRSHWQQTGQPLARAIVELEDRLLFYNPQGEVAREVPKGKGGIFTVSKGGTYLVLFERVQEATPSEPGLDQYKILDGQGNLLWVKEERKLHDLPEPVGFVYISDHEGISVFVYDYQKKIEFYDREGNLLQSVSLDISPYFEGDVSRDGRYFGYVTGRRGKVHAGLFQIEGQLRWQKPIPGEQMKGHVLLSPDASRMVVSAYHFQKIAGKRKKRLVGKTLLFDREGNLRNSLPLYFAKAAFSANHEYLALAYRGFVGLVRVRDGKILFYKEDFFQSQMSGQDCELRSLSASPRGGFVLVGCSRPNIQGPFAPQIFLLDRPGRVICQASFAQRFVSPTYPDFAQLSADGRFLAVVFRNSIEVYRIDR